MTDSPIDRPKPSIPGWSWVVLWTILGASLRFWNLGDKVPWPDEWSSILFSIGRGYSEIPLNTVFSLDTLLHPLHTPLSWQPDQVLTRLQTESNHPPLFFLIIHLWLHYFTQLWPDSTDDLLIVGTRAFSAALGTLTIPLSFGVAHSLGRSHPYRSIFAHFSALLMAISPFGVYLAQEARHYTLTLLWILVLIYFLGLAVRSLQTHRPLSHVQIGLWIGLNGLAIGTHFFYGVALVGGGVALLLSLGMGDNPEYSTPPATKPEQQPKRWQVWRSRVGLRLYAAGLGTAVGGGLWLTQWPRQEDAGLTQWLARSSWTELETWGDRLGWLLEPVGRILGWILTMVMGAPLEGNLSIGGLGITIGLILAGLAALVWILRLAAPQRRHATVPSLLLTTVLANSAVFFLLVYGRGLDLTLAPRYQFVSLPAVILFLAWNFAVVWEDSHNPMQNPRQQPNQDARPDFKQKLRSDFRLDSRQIPRQAPRQAPRQDSRQNPQQNFRQSSGQDPQQRFKQDQRLNWQRWAVMLVIGLGCWGSWSVVHNQLYQKPDQADIMIDRFQTVWRQDLTPEQQEAPFLLAFLHQSTGETGKLLSLAWEMQQHSPSLANPDPSQPLPATPQFFLAHWQNDRSEGSQALYQLLQTTPRPLSLWVVNFSAAPQDVAPFGCDFSTDRHPQALGYWSRLYYCPDSDPVSPAHTSDSPATSPVA
ncbi:MAG: glycosyltransferase family 39 protein, partial [Prochlorothrix sp.]